MVVVVPRLHPWLVLIPLLTGVAASGCIDSLPTASDAVPPPVLLTCPEPCMRPIGDPGLNAWEPHVAVDPLDPDHLVVGRNAPATDSVTGRPMVKLFAHITFDGGASWETVRLPTGPEAGHGHPMFHMTGGGDPVVTFHPDGTVLYAGLFQTYLGPSLVSPTPLPVHGSAATGYSTFVYRSPDGGRTWPEVTIVQSGNGALLFHPLGANAALWDANDKPWLAVAPNGDTLLAWANILSTNAEQPIGGRCDLVYATSTDGTRTWSEEKTLEKGGCFSGAAPVATANGTWHVAYFDYGKGDLKVATSRDGGVQWSIQTVGQATFMPTFAHQTLPDGTERLLLAYPQHAGEAGHIPVLIWSDDDGATWTEPLPVSRVGTQGRALPALATLEDGSAIVTFFLDDEVEEDRRARHLAVLVREGEVGEPLLLDAQNEWRSESVGDYVGLAALPNGAFSVWSSAIDGQKSLYGARVQVENGAART